MNSGDLIILVETYVKRDFRAKLFITSIYSTAFRRSIEAIHGYEDKVRIVLNKADQVDHQELMRVYGALMWSIAKVRSIKVFPEYRVSVGLDSSSL